MMRQHRIKLLSLFALAGTHLGSIWTEDSDQTWQRWCGYASWCLHML